MKVISMISGGIDSPVAAYLVLRNGCEVVFAHFHSFPIVSRASVYKTIQLVKILGKYQPSNILYLIPLGEIQTYLRTRIDPRYLIIFYRRFMFRIAERVAEKEGAEAIVTGESLGQVSSQTLPNLRTIEEAVSIPVIRPLIGLDKQEIMDLARKIGTYEISIRPQEDCCTLFVPKRQITAARLEKIKELEHQLPVEKLVKSALNKMERVVVENA
ncbi:MAG: hypothetical protein J7K49_04215 [Thaumarchaeota archaeon]|nr:hypothetical protein [Nitrososphaerota archaeon]